MSTVHFAKAAVPGLLALFLSAQALAQQAPVQPFKDELFTPDIVERRDGGAFERVDYRELRDINQRDEEPERRVRRRYVDLGVRKAESLETWTLPTGPMDLGRAGPGKGSAFSVIFIHGRNGDRRLGMNDYRFGGNFNRLKNLAVRNGGTFYAPSVKTFDAKGVASIAALVAEIEARSPGRPVILTCASMGSFLCWGISRDAATVARLKGMAILGGAADRDYPKSAAFKAKLPVWFTHGGNDTTYRAEEQMALYTALRSAGQPVRYTLFETGSHGTPVRMTDWRAVLNWILTTK
ncbi:alpha/beta hydrolase [Rhizobiaceae bacterium BDR2-2]|uniref:Alpha/beta hydrolase n=1 Tax=Ectorhizobium quercum TaxID=2965071 RepID=A0AAE3N088_9HYPH|nr:alpha/beta hydrolase [Ectorhizobium quercum]MCX8997716.1 alpha/beta hydrolase [Ectorhizobium quercum]